MRRILLFGVAALGIAAYSTSVSTSASARTVCNEDGRCWNETTDVGRDIVRGLFQGRSAHRDHDDWVRHRDYDSVPRRHYDEDD